MKDRRSKIEIKYAGVKRLLMWHYLGKKQKYVLVSEFPKSGGTWFSQLISEVLKMDFPRNQTPKFKDCILHGHHLYHSNFGKMIGIIRDGRDVMVSAYFHFLIENDRNSIRTINKMRSRLKFSDYTDVRENMPAFISYMFEDFTIKWSHFSWADCIESFSKNDLTLIVKYESLLSNAEAELTRSIDFLGFEPVESKEISKAIEKYSFKNQTNRLPGEEDSRSFLRKGVSGDWLNYFSLEAKELFNEYAGKELILAGYESDDTWVR